VTPPDNGAAAQVGGGVISAPADSVEEYDPGIAAASPPASRPGSPALAPWEERHLSYDVASFEVPRGREEQWRFTPLRRLRGLHDGSATATAFPVRIQSVATLNSPPTIITTGSWARSRAPLPRTSRSKSWRQCSRCPRFGPAPISRGRWACTTGRTARPTSCTPRGSRRC